MTTENLQEWLVAVFKGLLTDPESLVVEKTVDEQGVLFRVKVAKQDTGKVIGRKGNIAESLRTIVRAAGYLADVRASLIIDVPGSNFRPQEEFDEDPNVRPEDRK